MDAMGAGIEAIENRKVSCVRRGLNEDKRGTWTLTEELEAGIKGVEGLYALRGGPLVIPERTRFPKCRRLPHRH
jgi:hypothetical protein